MTKYLNFFESESGFTEAVEAGQLFFPNVSYTEDDDTVHWNLARSVKTPMLRMHFSTSTPGQEVKLGYCFTELVTAIEIDGTPVNYTSGGTYSVAEPGNHTAVYQFASPKITPGLFDSESGAFDTFTSAEITSAVTLIDFSAFKRCGGLTGVTIPDSVTTIGLGAFGHTGLRSVTVPDSVTTLGGYQFYHCTELRTATVGGGVTAILDQTFGECTSLQSVALPDGLKTIGYEVFINCYSLHDINIPSGVTTIGERAFIACSGLTEIIFNQVTPPTLGAAALDKTNNCPICVPAASVEAYKQAWPGYATRIKPMGKHRITASVNDDSLGRVDLYQETAYSGDTVGFTVFPSESRTYQVSVTDGNGAAVQVTDEGENYYTFTMPASDVTVLATIGEKPKYSVTVNLPEYLPEDIDTTFHFYDGDGHDTEEPPLYGEGEGVYFELEVVPDDGFQQILADAIDCDDNNIDVIVEDLDGGRFGFTFTMPGCDVNVNLMI